MRNVSIFLNCLDVTKSLCDNFINGIRKLSFQLFVRCGGVTEMLRYTIFWYRLHLGYVSLSAGEPRASSDFAL